MSAPLISVLLPNLNNRPFLAERIETIFGQTLSDWELVIVDNYSDDGAWEFFQQLAQKDQRVRICQAERQGMYANWNNCVRQASGQYVYIATSDDTMAPDCLEKLADALETHRECALAHCPLKIIDKDGRDAFDWWTTGSIFARSSGDLLSRRHIRWAPFDGLLHLSGESVYISITQLLIRRRLFDQVGLFEPRWGSVGDFNWDMRASLVANTVHVPATWGSWRTHSDQATAAAGLNSLEHCRRVDEMIAHAIDAMGPQLNERIRTQLLSGWDAYARDMRQATWGLRQASGPWDRKLFLLRGLWSGSGGARRHVQSRLEGAPHWPEGAPQVVRKWLETTGVNCAVAAV